MNLDESISHQILHLRQFHETKYKNEAGIGFIVHKRH